MTSLPVTPFLPRLRRSQHIAAELRRLIAAGEIPPGGRIPTEAALCSQFGVSRTTVREAIQALRACGVLEVTPGRGSFIRRPDPAPLLQELALVLTACGSSCGEASVLQQALLRDLVTKLGATTPLQRQELYQHLVGRQNSPAENAALEGRWQLALAKLAAQPLHGHLLQLLLAFTQPARERAMADDQWVQVLAQAQFRLTATLCDGDWPAAERLLPTLSPRPAPQAAAA
jgi:DNA-binding FadR family transcriptional regulator